MKPAVLITETRRIISKMRFPWRVSLGFLCVAIAWLSFRTGLNEFLRRVDVFQKKAETTGSETVYIGDVEWANRAASTGSWIAISFLALGICFLVRAIKLWLRRRSAVHQELTNL